MTPSGANRVLLHEGGILNARVYRVADGGASWIEKDFSANPWIVRNTLGRFLIRRECRILRRLEPTGVVPAGAERLSAFSLREERCPGFSLRDTACGVYAGNVFDPSKADGVPPEMLREPVPRAFFESLESAVKAAHRARFVHLDLHNARNVVVGPGWKPVLLDWQSAVPTAWLPRFLRRALERVDRAGVYKLWDRFRPGELSEKQMKFLRRSRFLRRHFWIPRLKWGKTKD